MHWWPVSKWYSGSLILMLLIHQCVHWRRHGVHPTPCLQRVRHRDTVQLVTFMNLLISLKLVWDFLNVFIYSLFVNWIFWKTKRTMTVKSTVVRFTVNLAQGQRSPCRLSYRPFFLYCGLLLSMGKCFLLLLQYFEWPLETKTFLHHCIANPGSNF